jgi:hypothetical protein
MIKVITSLIIIIAICLIPNLDNKNKFRVEMITNGIINKFILLGLAFYLTTLDVTVGILMFVLVLSLIYTGTTNIEITEGFRNYFHKK